MTDADLIAESLDRLILRSTRATLWPDLIAAGMTDILVGADISFASAAKVAQTTARHAAASTLTDMILAKWLLSQAGIVPGDEMLPTLFISAPGAVQVTREGNGWRADGILRDIAWTPSANAVAALVSEGGEAAVALFGALPDPSSRSESIAGETLLSFDTSGLIVPDHAVAALSTGCDSAQALAVAAFMRSAQMLGALEVCLELSVRYASERKQFGTPIGKFQAIQHLIAQIAGEVATVQVTVERAAAALDCGEGLLEVAIAKSCASAAAGRVAAWAHQVHGAIGFTDEYPLGRLTRRLWGWRDDFGSDFYWNAIVGKAALEWGAQLWPRLVDGEGKADADLRRVMQTTEP